MFYPLTAPRANAYTRAAIAEYAETTEALVQAYLQIAHVHIERAAKVSRTTTWEYFPYEVQKEVVARLILAGFKVEPIPNSPSRYRISWKEED